MIPRSVVLSSVRQPTVQCLVHTGTGWQDVSPFVITTDIRAEMPPLLSFGVGAVPSATVTLAPSVPILPTYTALRVSVSYVGYTTTPTVFVGYIREVQRSPEQVVWVCEGIGERLSALTIKIPVSFYRPAHTLTTATSVEDPNNPAYRGGFLNELFWRAGGRPFQQQSIYPNAPWYYDCSHSLITPAWVWLDGDNPWRDIDTLCRAVGSVVYQDRVGILRAFSLYRQLAGTPTFTYTDVYLTDSQKVTQNAQHYEAIDEQRAYDDIPQQITVPYVRRAVSGVGEIYRDTTIRYLMSSSMTITISTREPVVDVQRIDVDASVIAYPRTVPVTVSNITVAGQTITCIVSHTTGQPVMITGIRVFGRVVRAVEEAEYTYTMTSVTPEQRQLRSDDNPYVQDADHAIALATLLGRIYRTVRPEVRLRGCPADHERYVGEIVNLTCAALGYTNQRSLITAIDLTANDTMDVTVVPLLSLPDESMYYIVDTPYTAADTKLVGV